MSDVADYADFLRGLVRDPKGVSAPTPSSPALSRAIAAEVDIARDGLVVELGPGTGVVTEAPDLMPAMVPATIALAAREVLNSIAVEKTSGPGRTPLRCPRTPTTNPCACKAFIPVRHGPPVQGA